MSTRSLRKRSLFILGSGLLAAAFALSSGAVGSATAAWAAPTDIEYVALGDSYAAGLGIGLPTGAPVPGCGQSSSNYPHLVSAALGLDLTDVTCSGADTSNIIDTDQVTPSGTNLPQSGSLSADTDIVTLTIGGNDLGFADIIGACIANSADLGPTLFGPGAGAPNCESLLAPGGVDSLALKIDGPVSTGLAATFDKISEKAPNAKVFVVAYPALMPDSTNTPTGGCFTTFGTPPSSFPFTDSDVEYLHGVQAQLDGAISSAAATAGATFVPLFVSSLGNTPCAVDPTDAYINGVALDGLSLAPNSMHPNAAGAEFMADGLQASIMAALSAPAVTSTAPIASTTAGVPYAFNVTASGFPVPVLAIAGGTLPDGLEFEPTTGEISGTPTTAGTFTFSISATNGVGAVTSPIYTITVDEATITVPGSPDAPTVPTLVNTGAGSLLPIGLAGALTLLAGAGVLLTRRRASR